MADKLADETLADILAQYMAVADDDFACTTANKSPFASDALSSSTLLLVCKRWMRVATPLLYETVILRTVPQAMALAAALKAHADFGRYIKKVRVEGGVGASICSVFKAAPHITDLALTLDIYSGDKVGPMYKSLRESVAPRRLILCNPQWRLNANKATELAVEALCKCITEWSNLRVVVLPASIATGNESTKIYQAICQATQLEMIHFPQSTSSGFSSEFLSRLADNCAAPVIRVGWTARGTSRMRWPVDWLSGLSPRGRKKIQFAPPQEKRRDILPANPTFMPLVNCSQDTRRKIWSMILDVVITHTSGIDDTVLAKDWSLKQVDLSTRLPRGSALQCMLVCKEWKKLATPLACRSVSLQSPRAFNAFIHFLEAHKSGVVQRRVRSLRLCNIMLSDTRDIAGVERSLPSFLKQFDHLEHFDSKRVRMSPEALFALTSTVSRNLRSLALRTTQSGVYTLPSLPQLTRLSWDTEGAVIDLAVNGEGPPPFFPLLADLELSGDARGTLLRSFATFSMPALRTLEFDEGDETDLRVFLKAHGAGLRTVQNYTFLDMLRTILSACPNVTLIDVGYGSMPPSCMGPAMLAAPHTALEELIIPPLDCLKGSGNADKDDPEIGVLAGFLEQLLPARFPALRTIQMRQRDLWPTTQRKMAKHPMPALAEKMLARGIRIVDEQGAGWKPRMTAPGKRKKPAE